MDALMKRQLELEQHMIDSGRERFEQQLRDAIAEGRLSETSTGLKILLRSREGLTRGLEADQDRTGKMGPKTTKTGRYLAGLPPVEAAHIAIATTLNRLGSGRAVSIQALTDAMARNVEGWVQSWGGRIAEPTPEERIAPLPDKDRQHLGLSIFAILREVGAGLLTEQAQKREQDVTLLTLAPEVQATIAAAPELAPPRYLPCVVPPRPWADLSERGTGGGYHSAALRSRLTVLKVHHAPYLADVSHVNLSVVLAALNTVQATAWRINSPVYAAMLALEPGGLIVAGPKNPHPNAALTVAKQFLDDTIYFPHNMDWRGRFYPVPSVNIVSGSDAERGLFTFAEGKPIITEAAKDWLAIHGANVYGRKGTMRERVQWVQEHERMILASAANPLGETAWREANDGEGQWQFLAFCFEWAAFHRKGFGYVSSLPVGMDATSSVYQHLAALVRDEKLGRLVNLTYSEKPQDLYQDVADAVGVSRKVVKPAAMTMPYGSAHSTRRDEIRDKLPDLTWPALVDLTKKVDAEIRARIPTAFAVLDWLKAVARAASKANLPVWWVTPAGLPVLLREAKQESIPVPVIRDGISYRSRFLRDVVPFKLDKKRQVSGLAPSFVHSLDAAHLMLTVNAARTRGITSFAMVHDCYGTVAADAATLAETLRETFITMYETHDPLAELRDGLLGVRPALRIPEPPPQGTLDVSTVWQSEYFFS